MKNAMRSILILVILFASTYALSSSNEIDAENFLIIAHRGASAYAPEHTLPSYKLAWEMGADYLEIDLQMTKDGKLVAMHDKTIDRTTNGNGLVSDFTLADLKKLDAGSWFNRQFPRLAKKEYETATVPSLEEIFSYFGDQTHYYIETKSPAEYPGMEEALVKMIRAHGLEGESNGKSSVIVQSFSESSLEKTCKLAPEIPSVLLLSAEGTRNLTDERLGQLNACVQAIGPNFTALRKQDIAKIKAAGFDIHPFTVDDPAQMKKLFRWQANGAFTNRPDLLKKLLQEHTER